MVLLYFPELPPLLKQEAESASPADAPFHPYIMCAPVTKRIARVTPTCDQ